MNHRLVHAGIQFGILFAFWVILSGRMQARYLLTGAVASLIVVTVNRSLNPRATYGRIPGEAGFRWASFFFRYVPWLVWQIITANLQVAYSILHPKLPVDPHILRVPTPLHHEVAQTLLGNSITLTPGTLTVDIKDGTLIVHALSRSTARGVTSGELQARAARLFGAEEAGGDVRMSRSFDEIEGLEGGP